MDVSFLFMVLVVVAVIVAARKIGHRYPAAGERPRQKRQDPAPRTSVGELTATLRQGGLPPAVQVPFALQPGETCVGVTDADLEQWLEGDGGYTHKYVAHAGGLAGLAIGGAISAAGNARRRREAAREAAERWRFIADVRVYVTTSRIALQGNREWHDLMYTNMRTVEYDEEGLIVQMSGNPKARICLNDPEYWHVLVRRLAFNEVHDTPYSP